MLNDIHGSHRNGLHNGIRHRRRWCRRPHMIAVGFIMVKVILDTIAIINTVVVVVIDRGLCILNHVFIDNILWFLRQRQRIRNGGQ